MATHRRGDAVAHPGDRGSESLTEKSSAMASSTAGGVTLPPASSLLNPAATESDELRIARVGESDGSDDNNNNNSTPRHTSATTSANPNLYTDGAFSQSDPHSADGSQASNATTVPDQVFTPTPTHTHTAAATFSLPPPLPPSSVPAEPGGLDSQLLQLSELAAGQLRMRSDSSARKRTADGLVKSPVRGGGHSRTTSAVSALSTTSTIGEMASSLRNNLSWAAYKHKNGWEDKSFNEIESMVQSSQSTSPVSATSVMAPGMPRRGSNSPQHAPGDGWQRGSGSPPSILTNKPTLAPPASIRPSAGGVSPGAGTPNPRRNSSPRHAPSLLGQSHSLSHAGSPRTPAQGPPPLRAADSRRLGLQIGDAPLFPPHHDTREKDTAEALMFLSSPNNSANLKHSFSPAGSPGPQAHAQSQPTPRTVNGRHALPNGPRKALPNHRPAATSRRVEFEVSPVQSSSQPHTTPHSPMVLDSPITTSALTPTYNSPHRSSPRKRLNGEPGHFRSALSLDALMGRRNVPIRKPLTDKEVLKMLDRGADRMDTSSDEEDIIIPPRRNEAALSPVSRS